MNVQHVVDTGGYLAVFGLVMAECLGVPLPGETAVIAAGTYAGATHRLSVWLIFLCAAAAAVLGGVVGYWLGSWGGYRILRRWGGRIGFRERQMKLARYLFDRHGAAAVFFGRFVSVLRTYVSFLAGTARMRPRRFFAANVAGGVVWAAVYTFAAYGAGKTLSRLSAWVDIAVGVLAVLVVIVGAVMLHRRMRSLADAAEAAYPGPLEP